MEQLAMDIPVQAGRMNIVSAATRTQIVKNAIYELAETGKKFTADDIHVPWRNLYGAAFRECAREGTIVPVDTERLGGGNLAFVWCGRGAV